jgi:AraC-like DNA-binding protein
LFAIRTATLDLVDKAATLETQSFGRTRMGHSPAPQENGSVQHVDNATGGLQGLTTVAIAFIRSNYRGRITLRVLEEETGSNSFRIIRAFRRDLGITPHTFLIGLRVARAAELLLEGESAAEIASEVGFVDQSHMTRHFKRLCGKTPSRFLDDHRAHGDQGAEQLLTA